MTNEQAETKVCEIMRRRFQWPSAVTKIVSIGLAYNDPQKALKELQKLELEPIL